MKKIFLIMAVSAFTLTTVDVIAQDKTAATETTERNAENVKKEADALKARITQYTEKVEANKDNGKVDYEAEQVRIAEMKAKWETLSGETWKEEKKKK
ncbi:MAG: hypothetical protein KBF73_03695 [Flavobacteriales bacterium]|nr:hypothetical protein [Flavobacteriales bacterium]